jgi:hypothetical protein
MIRTYRSNMFGGKQRLERSVLMIMWLTLIRTRRSRHCWWEHRLERPVLMFMWLSNMILSLTQEKKSNTITKHTEEPYIFA